MLADGYERSYAVILCHFGKHDPELMFKFFGSDYKTSGKIVKHDLKEYVVIKRNFNGKLLFLIVP